MIVGGYVVSIYLVDSDVTDGCSVSIYFYDSATVDSVSDASGASSFSSKASISSMALVLMSLPNNFSPFLAILAKSLHI